MKEIHPDLDLSQPKICACNIRDPGGTPIASGINSKEREREKMEGWM